MSIKIGNVEFFAGPSDLGAPDNLETAVINFIDLAQKKLDIAVQELQSQVIAEAIVRARQRKVTVRIVLEQDYIRASRMQAKPFDPGGENEENRFFHDAFLRANIDVKVDYNIGIFHQKFIIRDGLAVLTGSANFTYTCMHKNLNHLVIINNPETARIYTREFNEIQKGHFGKQIEGHYPAPPELVVDNVPIKILFAPDHNPEMEIMKQMMKAKKRVDFAIFTFAQSSGIDDTMLKLMEFNMPVKGAFDGTQGGQPWSTIPNLLAHGAELYKVPTTPTLGNLHHKLMVLDDQLVITGSFNYTSDANCINDENILIIGDLNTTVPAQLKAQSQFGSFAHTEIERIITNHGLKL
jgi:phosphatidylserine/phosphatidylglycerophosphate/cardiolipin synthase-like enzyme